LAKGRWWTRLPCIRNVPKGHDAFPDRNVALLTRLPARKKELRINMECYPASISYNSS
jgi:hypothetical protein